MTNESLTQLQRDFHALSQRDPSEDTFDDDAGRLLLRLGEAFCELVLRLSPRS